MKYAKFFLLLLLVNFKVDSDELEPFSLNDRTPKKEDRFYFVGDDSAGVTVNEDGDPAMAMRY